MVARALVYQACPELRAAALSLLETEQIDEPINVTQGIYENDLGGLAKIVLDLSAEASKPTYEEVEEVKN